VTADNRARAIGLNLMQRIASVDIRFSDRTHSGVWPAVGGLKYNVDAGKRLTIHGHSAGNGCQAVAIAASGEDKRDTPDPVSHG
jgi:hypothetical protein